MTHNLASTRLAHEVAPSFFQCFSKRKITCIQSLLLLSECVKLNDPFTESVISGVMELCVLILLVCVFAFIHICMCILLYASFQTLGSTHVWLPAPVVKHHGVLSWKSKVQDGVMIPCILCTENLQV